MQGGQFRKLSELVATVVCKRVGIAREVATIYFQVVSVVNSLWFLVTVGAWIGSQVDVPAVEGDVAPIATVNG